MPRSRRGANAQVKQQQAEPGFNVGLDRGRLSRVRSAVTPGVPRPGHRCLRGAYSVNTTETAPRKPGCRGRDAGYGAGNDSGVTAVPGAAAYRAGHSGRGSGGERCGWRWRTGDPGEPGPPFHLGPLRSVRPHRVAFVAAAEPAQQAAGILHTLGSLRPGRWWPGLDEVIETARGFYPGRLAEPAGRSPSLRATRSTPCPVP